ncbi:hypothetical protein [Nocardia stercoris]|uniref:Uncharacterized protein n=1 Tax=Nocardia stercoris TaxID=2483361 RepID=A0A3M2KV04_9NOCA|nr:hypothetical protein [Nocardia stercoris]RMI28260.1 hypothetical protein EBN03_30910 [Nocardia stercoris]
MTFWLVALVIWMAAGARVGRVLVKPATTARTAIVVAVAAVATAATVAIPEVGLAVDHLYGKGIGGVMVADRVVTSAWVLFGTATSVVAAAAWPIVSRRNLGQIARLIYGTGLTAILVTMAWSLIFGWVMVAFSCVFIAITGARHLDWTALGRGIALYTTGTVVVAGLAVASIRQILVGEEQARPADPGWFWPVWQVAALLIALGAVWIVIELWVRARLLLRRIRGLHKTMLERFPEVMAHESGGTATQLKASDQIAQIMDALYLQSGGGVELAAAGVPPESVPERANRVARWAHNPLGELVIDARWISPPEGVSPRGWVQAIAREFEVCRASEPARAAAGR